MKRIFLIVGFVLLVLKPSFAGPGPGPGSSPNCQTIYDQLKAMDICPPVELGLDGCVEGEAVVEIVAPDDGVPFCALRVSVSDIPNGITTGSAFKAIRENGSTKSLGEVILVGDQGPSDFIFFETGIDAIEEFKEYKYFSLHEDNDLDCGILLTAVTCGGGGQDCVASGVVQPNSQGVKVSGITDLGSGIGGGIGGKVPMGDVADAESGKTPTGDLGSSKQGSKSTAGGASQSEGGTLTGCYQISPTVPYHFSMEWFGLLALLLVGFRRFLIAR